MLLSAGITVSITIMSQEKRIGPMEVTPHLYIYFLNDMIGLRNWQRWARSHFFNSTSVSGLKTLSCSDNIKFENTNTDSS